MSKFHLIGIGGAGMSVVAELLLDSGMEVSGSDQTDSVTLHRLSALGITTYPSHESGQVPVDAVVVVSTAIKDTNPELAIARARGQRIIHRSQALALAATGMRFVAVAGAHGKTTTSGMLAVLLSQAGMDPSFAVGSTVKGFGSGAHLGEGDIFVAEADESDASFLNYSPTVEIVTSIEPDHLDFYGSFEKVESAFVDFVGNLNPDGLLVAFADNAGSARLAMQAQENRNVVTYGLSSKATVRITEITVQGQLQRVSLESPWGIFSISLSVGGVHNALNATAAWIAAIHLGVDPDAAAQALAAFEGTARRFDFKGEAGGIRVYDDYAHHPTEVKMALQQARQVAADGRVVVAFQPHLYSRTEMFAKEFAHSLDIADLALVTDIYRAREDVRTDIDASTITRFANRAVPSGDLQNTLQVLLKSLRPKDLLVTMGAGNITTLGPMVLSGLESGDSLELSEVDHG